MTLSRRNLPMLAGGAILGAAATARRAEAATAAEIRTNVQQAEQRLRGMENAAPLFANAQAVLIFPRIVQGGFIVGGQYGEGALMRRGSAQGYYRIIGASFGLQAGAQTSGLAMFFMTEAALRALDNADGWEIGTGPSVVALDRGLQANVTSTTLTEPVYAITFGQQGLMAALALNGTKITRFTPEG
jgi:lipid-binding SYLF domain-containing protein